MAKKDETTDPSVGSVTRLKKWPKPIERRPDAERTPAPAKAKGKGDKPAADAEKA